MFPVESFRKTLVKIVDILRRLDIPFHLTGGITTVAYGEPRLTQDIDIVLHSESTQKKVAALLLEFEGSDFIFERASIEKAVQEKKMFQLFDKAESLKLDMYPREMIPGELRRSVNAEIFEHFPLPIVSRVDAAASKLAWVSKGSHKSRRDFRQIVRTLSDTQQIELRNILKTLGLSQLMNEVLQESDEIE